jgi:hypothetical protein
MNCEQEVGDCFINAVRRNHRTLQQNFFGHILLRCIKDFAKRHDEGQFDARNEESCKAAKRMETIANNTYLPFI